MAVWSGRNAGSHERADRQAVVEDERSTVTPRVLDRQAQRPVDAVEHLPDRVDLARDRAREERLGDEQLVLLAAHGIPPPQEAPERRRDLLADAGSAARVARLAL